MLSRLIATSVGLAMVLTWSAAAAQVEPGSVRVLLIVVDGLRPDYITSQLMPNLHAMGESGVFGERHTAAYPSYTRVNSASISAGSYPGQHGLMNNDMYLPEVSEEPFSTGSAAQLRRMEEAKGRILTSPSLAEVLEEHDKQLFVTGSSGSGAALLLNPGGTGMGIWTARGFFVPRDAREEAIEAVGETADERPEQTVWGVDAYLHRALGDDPPDVSIVWINEPDSAGHAHGVGAPETMEAVANVDEQIGRIIAAHEEHGLEVNIFVTTDHGFSQSRGGFNPMRRLREADLAEGVTVVRNMIFVEPEDPQRLAKMVEALQRDDAIGNIYTRPVRPGAADGFVPGTLSLEVIRWNHEHSSVIAVSPAWTDEVNEHGYAGATTFGGTATHGSDSPFDLQIRLVAAGPHLRRGMRSEVPTGNIDFAPTILHLMGIKPPQEMEGRVLRELLDGGPDPEDVPVHEQVHTAAVQYADGFRYEARLQTLRVGSTPYLRGAETRRSLSDDE